MDAKDYVTFQSMLWGVGAHRYLDTWIQKICQVSKKSVSKSIQEYPRVSKSINFCPKCQEVWRKNMFFLDTWILGSQKFAKYPKKLVSKSIHEYLCPPPCYFNLQACFYICVQEHKAHLTKFSLKSFCTCNLRISKLTKNNHF